MSDDLNLDTVMSRRFELVEQMDIISARHKAELQPLSEELKLCESFIRSQMLDGGMQQFKSSSTGHMTFFTTKDSVTVRDMSAVIGFMLAASPPPPPEVLPDPAQWPNVLAHIHHEGMWGLLNNAVNKTAAKELIEKQTPPPGVEYSAFRDLTWRRGKV